MLKHPLTIHLLWTLVAWTLALVLLSWQVLVVWFILSMIGWGVFFKMSMLIEDRQARSCAIR